MTNFAYTRPNGNVLNKHLRIAIPYTQVSEIESLSIDVGDTETLFDEMEVDAFNNATILIKSDKDLTLTVYQGFMTSAGTVSYIYEDTTAVTGGTGTGQLISLYGPYLMIEAENADIAGAVVNACIVLRSIA